MDDLKSELSSNFEDVILGLMTPTVLYDVQELRKAMKVSGTCVLSVPVHTVRGTEEAVTVGGPCVLLHMVTGAEEAVTVPVLSVSSAHGDVLSFRTAASRAGEMAQCLQL